MHRQTTTPDSDRASCRSGPWLRSNPRPAMLLAILGVLPLIGLGFVGAVRACLAPALTGGPLEAWGRGWWGAASIAGGFAATALFAATAATFPRLERRGNVVRVRLSPWRVEPVPLEMVECFFLGSRLEPPRSDDGTTGGDRVRTLVMRIAERATAHADRATFPPWGAWQEGSVTFDGRWCEPLSVDLVRRLNRDLSAAKREAAGRTVAAGVSP